MSVPQQILVSFCKGQVRSYQEIRTLFENLGYNKKQIMGIVGYATAKKLLSVKTRKLNATTFIH